MTDVQENDTSESVFGGGGRIYRDSRPMEEPHLDLDPEVPPWADQPEPLGRPGRPVTATPTPEPDPEPQPDQEPEPAKAPRDWRETFSTLLELAGMGGLVATGFIITLWLGVLIASICLLFIGVAISRKPATTIIGVPAWAEDGTGS